MNLDLRILARMSDDHFQEFVLAVLDEAIRRCLLVVVDERWQLAVDAVAQDHDIDGSMIRLSLER